MVVQNVKNIIIYPALLTAVLLLIPLTAMQFTTEVNWTLFDFVVAGCLLFGTGVAYGVVSRKGGTASYRAGAAMALSAALLLTWMNLAVGIIGNENNPVNLLYFGVILVGLMGAVFARLKPRGMATALYVTALAQTLVPFAALLYMRPVFLSYESLLGLLGIFLLNTFFVALFLGSAFLFQQSTSVGKSLPT